MQLLFYLIHLKRTYLLFFAMLVSLPLFFPRKCLNIFRFRSSITCSSFSSDSTRLLRACHSCGFCKWDALWIFSFAPLRSTARLIFAVLLRRSDVHPFLGYPFT